ncbi:hypothetical protein [Salinibacter grassmerensis]|uniref:hypothetical protein n=1 Tax=Salinibacter grassmerensis TaxID=3040353 RepID=UPI0021E8460E|nr:hypothetical protein [Salinibacter grassmerensis]
MNDGSITLYEETGTQNDFGYVEGVETVLFESSATVDEEGITTAGPDGGFEKVGDLTVFPSKAPDYTAVSVGMKAKVTTRTGDEVICSVAEYQPKGAFNGAIVVNRK